MYPAVSCWILSVDGYFGVARSHETLHVMRSRLIWLIGRRLGVRRVVSLRYRSGNCGLRGRDPIRGMPSRSVNHLHRDTNQYFNLGDATLRVYDPIQSLKRFDEQSDVLMADDVIWPWAYYIILASRILFSTAFKPQISLSSLVTASTGFGGERMWSDLHCLRACGGISDTWHWYLVGRYGSMSKGVNNETLLLDNATSIRKWGSHGSCYIN